ncbi:Molybdopterin oxidoreductase iron-sulfur binding subunit [Perkinsela sp. CCAP 1560/4]|nr:Molybdopterin oxidoreductase iron-sulfur binding subunit [Perkinsela sp. CCAP 1560/4]|eukprot:KNH08942.1 Molybdopterin oxidoreductase iron-sulfur binding subunit [Perkinsela sp. CCAP 1560/4]
MKRGKANSLRIEVKSFLQNKKGSTNQTSAGPEEEKLDTLLALCPAASLSEFIRSTPSLNLYEKDIFTAPGTPFGNYGIGSYMKLVEFLSERHPHAYTQKPIEQQTVKKAKKEGIHSTLKEKANRISALALLFDEVRDPTLWHAQSQKFSEIFSLCNLNSSNEAALDNAQYIVGRCISGVFSEFFYKSIISTRLLAYLTLQNKSDEFVHLVTKRIVEILQKLNAADSTCVAHAKLPGLEGIKPLKLYAGALLLVVILRVIEKGSLGDNAVGSASVDSTIQFQTLCTIHAKCISIREWCFSVMSLFLLDGKNNTHTNDVHESGVLPLAEYVYACAKTKTGLPEFNLLAHYLRPSAISKASLSPDLGHFFADEVSQDLFSEKSLAQLLESVRSPHGFIEGHSHVHKHPLLVDFSKQMHLRCASESPEEIIQRTNTVYEKLIRKFDFTKKVESMVGKFICDAVCHCVLAYGVGPSVNHTIFTYYTFALESFGSYTLPAVKTTTASSQQVIPENKTADFYQEKVNGLLLQFNDINQEKYGGPVDKLSMEDFTIDSSDDDEEDIIPEASLGPLGITENTQKPQSSLVHFLRDHVIRMIQQAALHAKVCPQTLEKIFGFFLGVALSPQVVGSDLSANPSVAEEIDISHQLMCMNSLACVVYPVNRPSISPDVSTEEKSHGTRNATKQQVLLKVLDGLSISKHLQIYKKGYLALVSTAKSAAADMETVQLSILLALRGAWDELSNPTSARLESCADDMTTISSALKQLSSPSTKKESPFGTNMTFHEAFQRLYATAVMAPVSQKFSTRLAEVMEQFCAKHYGTLGDTELRSRFTPVLRKEDFRGKALQDLFDGNAIRRRDLSKKTSSTLAADVVHNLLSLRLLAVIFPQLSDAMQAEMLFRWIACFYALSSNPILQPTDHRELHRLLEGIVRSLNFHPTVSIHSHGLYTDASMQTPFSADAESHWTRLLGLSLTILRTQTKHRDNHRWVKETCSKVLRKLYSSIVVIAEKPARRKAPAAPVSPLIASFQEFFLGLIECRSFPPHGKHHFLSCIPQNATFSVVFVLPTLTDYVLRVCGKGEENAKDDAPSVFDCQCVQIVLETLTQTMRTVEKSELRPFKEAGQAFGKKFLARLATTPTETFQRMCSKSFLEICGPSFYRVLSMLRKADAESAKKVKELYERSMKYIEKHRIAVPSKQMRQIRDYMRQ